MKLPFRKQQVEKSNHYVPTTSGNGWGFRILEAFSGAWQRNIEYGRKDVLCYHAVFACISLIAGDISKLRIKMVSQNSDGIWVDIPIPDNLKVIDKPNNYQNRIQFYECWLNSKLIRGNTYVFKQRDSNGVVREMHVLHPDRVLPLVTDDGDVYYQISQDNLSGIKEGSLTVPASEIIHDRYNCFYHPLVGLSPIYAAGLPAYMGVKMLENNAVYFANGSRPSGVLTIPEAISKEQAALLKEQWELNYSGENQGKTAVLGGDVKYQALSLTNEQSQMMEMMKMTGEMVCSTFHVPPYKASIGNAPSYDNVQALNLEYYNSALHRLIEDIELCLDQGLKISNGRGTEFDLEGLLRMDTKAQVEMLGAAVTKAIYSPNEARKQMNKPAIAGGDVPFLQQQMWPIDVIAKRSIEELTGGKPAVEQQPTDQPEKSFDMNLFTKMLEAVDYAI